MWIRKLLGGNESAMGESILQTDDGGYVIAGHCTTPASDKSDVCLIKTDKDGQELWSHTYGGEETDLGFSIQQTDDDGYIITGVSRSYGISTDVYLLKVGQNGKEEWFRTFGEDEVGDTGYSVKQTSDGGYIIAGSTYSVGSHGHGGLDVYVIKTDDNGLINNE